MVSIGLAAETVRDPYVEQVRDAAGGQRDAASELLASVHNWFTEDFDTKDLNEDKTILAELKV